MIAINSLINNIHYQTTGSVRADYMRQLMVLGVAVNGKQGEKHNTFPRRCYRFKADLAFPRFIR